MPENNSIVKFLNEAVEKFKTHEVITRHFICNRTEAEYLLGYYMSRDYGMPIDCKIQPENFGTSVYLIPGGDK